MNLHAINTGYFKLDGGAMFGVVPKSIWQKLNPPDANNMCSWALRCLLIEEGDRLILVDTGMGDKQDAKFFSYYYLHGDDTLDRSLAAKGFHRDDITDVFQTHLHFDHCGGSIRREGDKLTPAFKNASYWCSKEHWEWAINPNAREKASFLKENILPIRESGQLKLIDSPGASSIIPAQAIFMENFSIRFVNGHTEGMMLPQLIYKDRTVVFMADLLPSQAHIPIPYVMAYDTKPLVTLTEKKAFLEEAATNNYVLFLEHDPEFECCTVVQTEKGVRLGETLRLEEL